MRKVAMAIALLLLLPPVNEKTMAMAKHISFVKKLQEALDHAIALLLFRIRRAEKRRKQKNGRGHGHLSSFLGMGT